MLERGVRKERRGWRGRKQELSDGGPVWRLQGCDAECLVEGSILHLEGISILLRRSSHTANGNSSCQSHDWSSSPGSSRACIPNPSLSILLGIKSSSDCESPGRRGIVASCFGLLRQDVPSVLRARQGQRPQGGRLFPLMHMHRKLAKSLVGRHSACIQPWHTALALAGAQCAARRDHAVVPAHKPRSRGGTCSVPAHKPRSRAGAQQCRLEDPGRNGILDSGRVTGIYRGQTRSRLPNIPPGRRVSTCLTRPGRLPLCPRRPIDPRLSTFCSKGTSMWDLVFLTYRQRGASATRSSTTR